MNTEIAAERETVVSKQQKVNIHSGETRIKPEYWNDHCIGSFYTSQIFHSIIMTDNLYYMLHFFRTIMSCSRLHSVQWISSEIHRKANSNIFVRTHVHNILLTTHFCQCVEPEFERWNFIYVCISTSQWVSSGGYHASHIYGIHGIRTNIPPDNIPGQYPPDNILLDWIPLDNILLDNIPPEQYRPWTIYPWTISP